MFFKANNKQNQSTIDELKEINSLQQLTAGLITFLHIRTSLMKLYDRICLNKKNEFLKIFRYERISGAVKSNEHNVRLEIYREEISAISQIDMSSLNISILNPISRLLK